MDMKAVLTELNIQTAPEGHHHTTAGRINIDCPWCSSNTGKYRLGIYADGGWWCNCWTCGRHKLADTLAEAASLPLPAVYAELGTLTKGTPRTAPSRHGRLVLPGQRGKLLPAHRKYLGKRKFDPDELEEVWKFQGIGMATHLAWRLFIPIYLDGEIASWTTRAISDATKFPYLSAKPEQEKYPHKELLYGMDLCNHCIVINEGPLDAVAVGPGGVATCGTGYTTAQLLKMSRFPIRVVLFDSEPDAQRRAQKLCQELEVFDGASYNVQLQTGKDASRASKREIRELRKRFLE
jgi:hypothetical protein